MHKPIIFLTCLSPTLHNNHQTLERRSQASEPLPPQRKFVTSLLVWQNKFDWLISSALNFISDRRGPARERVISAGRSPAKGGLLSREIKYAFRLLLKHPCCCGTTASLHHVYGWHKLSFKQSRVIEIDRSRRHSVQSTDPVAEGSRLRSYSCPSCQSQERGLGWRIRM